MTIRSFAAAASLFLLAGPAMAQAPAAVHAACATYLAPAYAEVSKTGVRSYRVDCSCVSGFLIGRYGAADAEIIVRLFAVAGGGSEREMEAVSRELGVDRIRAVIGKVGKFQDLGRDMKEACPEIGKP